MMQEQIQEFKIGDVVWAKITGYPWWPGQVFDRMIKPNPESDFKQEYSIMFFGDNSHAYLPASKLASYQQKYQQFAARQPTKKFQQAIAKANLFTSTGQGSLLDQDFVIDSHPICSSFDKSTTLAQEDKLHRMAEVEEIPQTNGFINANNFEQKILFQEFSEEDLKDINSENIVQLLEYGLFQVIRNAQHSNQYISSIQQRLKQELLKKYNLYQQQIEEPVQIQQILSPQPLAIKTKKSLKKKRCYVDVDPKGEEQLSIRRLCITKVYQFLKTASLERSKAMKQSILIIERLVNQYDYRSYQFKLNFKRLLKWLSVHGSSALEISPEYIYQKLEDFLQQILGSHQIHVDEKSKVSEQTTCSQTK